MLADELKKIVRGEVLSDDATLTTYSTDASIFKVRPEVVVCPQDVNDIKALVRFVKTQNPKPKTHNLSLTARSGGTDMTGGPLTESIVIDFTKHINRLISIEGTKDGGTAVVEPGLFYRDFEEAADKLGLMMPSYPASKSICTMGGIVSNNSGGEKTLAYGKTEAYVEELSVVFSDGNEYVVRALTKKELDAKKAQKDFEGDVYRKLGALLEKNKKIIADAKPNVTKNSAGYYLWNVEHGGLFDLPKLIVGSQGTLGLVTKIKFRLVKKKQYSRLSVIFLKDLAPLTKLIPAVLQFKPESFESFDDNTMKLALKFLPDILKILRAKNFFSLGFQFLPEVFMMLRGGIPRLILLAEFTSDDAEELDRQLAEFKKAMSAFPVACRVTRNAAEAEKYWTMRRESFNLLRHRIKGKQTAPFIDDIVVRPERLVEFLPRLNAILKPYERFMIYTIAGHVGDGNFHIIPLMNLADTAARAAIPKLSDEVYKLVMEFKGSITAEHNDGLIRSPYLQQMYGEDIYGLFEDVKGIFDPDGIFNPGKKVGSSLSYSFSHIK